MGDKIVQNEHSFFVQKEKKWCQVEIGMDHSLELFTHLQLKFLLSHFRKECLFYGSCISFK